MKNEFTLSSLGTFVVRAPFLSTDTWFDYRASGAPAKAASPEAVWTQRGAAARTLFDKAEVREAIYLASRNLYHRLAASKWDMQSEVDRKLLSSFERYINRMCFRSTPFGLFATISTGKIVANRPADPLRHFGGNGTARRELRIDFNFLNALRTGVERKIGRAGRLLANRSVCAVGQSLRYIEWRDAGSARSYFSSEISSHVLIDAILSLCASEPVAAPTLVARVMARHPDYAEETIAELVDDLSSAKVLTHVTGLDVLADDPVEGFAAHLLASDSTAAIGRRLLDLTAAMKLTCLQTDNRLAAYAAFEADLGKLAPASISGPFLRLDAFRDETDLVLDQALTDRVLHVLGEFMCRFGQENRSLDAFAAAFGEHYGEGSVALTTVLDHAPMFDADDSGTGNDMLRRLGIVRYAHGPEGAAAPSKFDRFMIGKLLKHSHGPGGGALRILPEDLDDVAPRPANFAQSMFAIMTLLPTEPEAPQRAWIQGVANFDAGSWLGRFCYGSPELRTALQTTADAIRDGDPDVLHAEIAYLPGGGMGNIMTRPLIWPYRISLVEGCAAPNEIALSDIVVSVKKGRIEIWSASRGKRIIPHMTSAHSVDHPGNIKAYTFLRQLEAQGKTFSQCNWGAFFSGYAFLPRIEFEELILAPARWLVEWSDYAKAAAQPVPASLHAFLKARGVPAVVELKEGDNTLVLDMDDAIDIDQLFKVFRRQHRLHLREVLGGAGDGVRCAGTRHEVILPFRVRDGKPLPGPQAAAPDAAHLATPDMMPTPMREAIYAKIYLPHANVDAVLLHIFHQFIAKNVEQGRIDRWFFIRYADPYPHLRLRVFPRDAAAYLHVMGGLTAMLDALVRERQVEQFAFSTYQRELVRYGGERLMPLNERLFSIDSTMAVHLIEHYSATIEQKWMGPVWAIHALLEDFQFDLDENYRIAADMASSYKKEFRVSSRQIKLLGLEYRKHGAQLEALLVGADRMPVQQQRSAAALSALRAERRSALGATAALLAELPAERRMRMVQSQIHMLCNRLVSGNSRAQEVFVYDMLERWYRSSMGRRKVASVRMAADVHPERARAHV